ncbi:MAG: type II toxin-antitoxin system RelE/ParE family toxin [Acidobacteriaceae bacterium]|nr:type II toxin-antitoxin system RelE/ParE family toxin [Acidobacteriaceae bacterium]
MKVREYITEAGKSPFGKWFAGLNGVAAAKITIALERIAEGNLSNVKALGGGVSEYKIDFGPGYRIYFGQDGKTLVILLCGGSKKSQPGDIQTAQANWADYTSARRPKREAETVPLTKDFRETVRERAQRDASFRRALLSEAVELLLSGEVERGQSIMRQYINATMGFEELAKETHIPKTSLMRMFGPHGNPSSKNMFGVIAGLAKAEGVNFYLKAKPAHA